MQPCIVTSDSDQQLIARCACEYLELLPADVHVVISCCMIYMHAVVKYRLKLEQIIALLRPLHFNSAVNSR
jgi:hypothetical protein